MANMGVDDYGDHLFSRKNDNLYENQVNFEF